MIDMDHCNFSIFSSGTVFLCRLPTGKDLASAIADCCQKHGIQAATFSLAGTLSSATLGVYDQQQQVYVTHTESLSLEIITGTGTVSLKEGKPNIHGTVSLADVTGNVRGGRLFSPSRIFAVEMTLRELIGDPLIRAHDQETGLELWQHKPMGRPGSRKVRKARRTHLNSP